MRRQRRSRALVPVAIDNCPSCDGDVVPRTVDQLPLLRHGGHGAVRRTITLHCARPCGWSLEKSVTEVSPR